MQLVDQERLPDGFFEQVDLHGVVVGDTEMPHLAGGVEHIKSLGDFLRLDEGVGTVDGEHIEIVGAEPGEDAVHGCENVLFGTVVHPHAGTDAAFGLDEHLIPWDGISAQRLAEHAFAFATAVNIGIVEKVESVIDAETDIVTAFFCVQTADAHTAHRHRRNSQIAFTECKVFHYITLSFFIILDSGSKIKIGHKSRQKRHRFGNLIVVGPCL